MHPSHTHQAGIPHTGTKAGFQVQGDYKDPERGPHQGLPSLTLPPGAAAGGGARLGRGRWAFPVVPSRRAGWESPPHSSERKTPEARLLRNWGDVTAGGSRGAAAGHRERGQRDSACGARPTASLSRLAAWFVKGLREYTKAATRPRVQRRGPRAGGAAGPVAWPASARARGLTGTRLRLRELARPAKGQWRPQADVGDPVPPRGGALPRRGRTRWPPAAPAPPSPGAVPWRPAGRARGTAFVFSVGPGWF